MIPIHCILNKQKSLQFCDQNNELCVLLTELKHLYDLGDIRLQDARSIEVLFLTLARVITIRGFQAKSVQVRHIFFPMC